MTEREVRFSDLNELKKFCSICCRMEADIDVQCGKFCIDAKSILGLLSVGIGETFKMVVFDDAEEEVDHHFAEFYAERKIMNA